MLKTSPVKWDDSSPEQHVALFARSLFDSASRIDVLLSCGNVMRVTIFGLLVF